MEHASNTRFAPTPAGRGEIHLGHIWLCMLNKALAEESGGSFIVRIDDLSAREYVGEGYTRRIVEDMLKALPYFGCKPDIVLWESEAEHTLKTYINSAPWISAGWKDIESMRPMNGDWQKYLQINYERIASGVVRDYLYNCNPVVRGCDLQWETALYWAMCDYWGFPKPSLIYIPRVSFNGEAMSKSGGAVPAIRLLDKYSPEILIDAILHGCLKDPEVGICLHNIKTDCPNIEV